MENFVFAMLYCIFGRAESMRDIFPQVFLVLFRPGQMYVNNLNVGTWILDRKYRQDAYVYLYIKLYINIC